jgi:alcohol dehydrogenase
MKNNYDAIMPRLIFGEDSSKNVGSIFHSMENVHSIMAIFDEGIKNAGISDPIIQSLKDDGFVVEEFGDIERDPSTDTIERAADIAKEKNVDAFVAIGGGGVIDVTKCVAMLSTNPGRTLDYELGVGKPIPNKCKPWVGIPTTSGTGSEVTCLSIVTNTKIHRKVCVKDVVKLRATAAILDPKLAVGLPKGLTATTGMDALSHAVEGYLVPIANEYSDIFCEAAIKKIVQYLPTAVSNGADLKARGEMMKAASYASIGFANSTLQIGHSIAHALGESVHVPHGMACAWGLPFAIRRCGEVVSFKRLQRLAGLLGIDVCGLERTELIHKCEEVVLSMNEELNVPTPKEYGIGSPDEMEKAYKACVTMEQPMLQAGGVKITDDSVHDYFEEMWRW